MNELTLSMKKNLLLHLKRALLSSALLLMSSVSAKAGWLPFINNYGRSDYGSGMSTWRIVPYGKWTFFTNQRGLLVYDGVSWTKYQLNNRSEVRGVAVFPEMRRVYVGGENEYGYFELDSQGRMVYHCISETVDKKYGRLGNIWEIYELNNVLYLRGDNCILVIAGEKMSLIKPPYKIFSSVMINGAIYVATDHGVMVIVGNQLQPITNGEKLKGKRINAMFQYGKNMIVTTATDGMFFFDGQNVTPFTTQADEQLRQGVICCATFKDGKIAVGTIHNGLYIINTKTGNVQNFNEKKGLQNNTVLSVAFDHNGSVWAGMSYGIDQVLLEDPFSYLYRSPSSYGIGYSVSIFKGKLYLGTDRGLYVADYPVVFTNGMPEIRQVSCPSGPAWFLYQNGDELFCLHDKGIFSIQGTTATRVTDIIGAWSCSVIKGHPDRMLVGLYDGMCLLVRKDGHWTSEGSVSGISESCRYFRQTGEHQVKVYDRNIGRARVFNLSKDWRKVVSQQIIWGGNIKTMMPTG